MKRKKWLAYSYGKEKDSYTPKKFKTVPHGKCKKLQGKVKTFLPHMMQKHTATVS